MPAGKTPRDHTAFRFELNAAALSYGYFTVAWGLLAGTIFALRVRDGKTNRVRALYSAANSMLPH